MSFATAYPQMLLPAASASTFGTFAPQPFGQQYFGQQTPFGMPWISPTAGLGGVGVLPFGIDPLTAAWQHAAIQQRIAFQQLARLGVLGNPWSVGYLQPWGHVGAPLWGQPIGNPPNIASHPYQSIGVDPVTAAAAQLASVA
jgi:hypothetical protein